MSLKVIIVGQTNCGKTCLVHRIESGEFDKNIINTVMIDYKTIVLKGKSFQFYDLSGQENYRNIVPNLFHNAKIAIIAFSIDSMDSFKETDLWYEKIKNSLNVEDSSNVNYASIILVGTKLDHHESREVSNEQGEEKAESFGQSIKYIELSSLNGENVNILIDEIVNLSNRFSNSHEIANNERRPECSSGCC